MVRVYLGLGSNMGDSRVILSRAVTSLAQQASPVGLSSLYRTAPMDFLAQADFYNLVLALDVEDTLDPDDFFGIVQTLEQNAGRVKIIEKGPRTLDIDILLWGSLRTTTKNLILPHPGLAHRRFVLAPLLEIAPDLCEPDGIELKHYLKNVMNQGIYAQYPLAYNGSDIWNNPSWSHQHL